MKKHEFLILLSIFFNSCTVGSGGEILEIQGIYEGKSKVDPEANIYRFDSHSDSTVIYRGSDNYIRFFDLNSMQFIEIDHGSNYQFNCIKEY